MDPLRVLYVAAVVCFVFAAAISDYRTRRLPNWLTVPACAAALVLHTAINGLTGLAFALAGFATGFLILLVLWFIGGSGGGDVKLMAATATWLGIAHLPDFLVLSAVAGAPVALAARLAHRVAMARSLREALPAGPGAWPVPERETVPLAVAVALGAVGALYGSLS